MIQRLTTKITRKKLDIFLKRYASNKKTLDIGCSKGPYKKYFPNSIGVDIEKRDGVDVVADAHALPFKDAEFDVVLCTEVLEHLHTPVKAISEMSRVLKKGGLVILTTRFIFPLHDTPHDYYRYTKYGLEHLFRDWDILELREEANTAETIAVLIQRIGFQTQLYCNRLLKIVIFMIAKCVSRLSFLIRKEYGDILRENEENIMMTSGYYIVCKKSKLKEIFQILAH